MDNTDSFATLNETLDLSGSSGCLLTYSMRIEVETDFDFLVPEISIDGGATWEEIHFGWSGTTLGEWFTFVDDIGAWDGESTVRIRFHLLSDSTIVGPVADIDDVGVHCATSPGNSYGHLFLDGTSMATPHVAGAAAILKARRSLATPGQIKDALLSGVDARPALAGKTVTGGRLNLHTSHQLLRTVPDAPTSITATPGDGRATVSWAPPADGGSPVAGYVVTPFIGTAPQPSMQVGNTTEALIGSLVNGTTYTFTVKAQNALGDGPVSPPSSAVTPRGTPTAVMNLEATAGNAQATIIWSAPSSDGGSPIMGYVVTPLGPSPRPAIQLGNTTRTVVTGLGNGVRYRFQVAARNALGEGLAGVSNEVIPRAPAAPAVAGAAKVAPAKPKAGGAVTATVRVTAGGAPVKPVKVTCAGSIGKAKVKGKPRAAAGSAKCVYKTHARREGEDAEGLGLLHRPRQALHQALLGQAALIALRDTHRRKTRPGARDLV